MRIEDHRYNEKRYLRHVPQSERDKAEKAWNKALRERKIKHTVGYILASIVGLIILYSWLKEFF